MCLMGNVLPQSVRGWRSNVLCAAMAYAHAVDRQGETSGTVDGIVIV